MGNLIPKSNENIGAILIVITMAIGAGVFQLIVSLAAIIGDAL